MVAIFIGSHRAVKTIMKKNEQKKSNQGFASSKYNPEKKRAAQSKGGSARVAKGFAKMSPEKRRKIARMGGIS